MLENHETVRKIMKMFGKSSTCSENPDWENPENVGTIMNMLWGNMKMLLVG